MASCPSNCSGNGNCGDNGVCTCQLEYYGDDCSQFKESGLEEAFILALVLGVIWFALFCILRDKYPRFYFPKCFSKESWAPKACPGWIYWMISTYRFEEALLLESPGGLDAAIYLRFLKYCCYLLSGMTLFGLCVIMPVNSTGQYDATKGELYRLTLAHVQEGSNSMWTHFIFAWLFSFMTFYCMYRYCQADVELSSAQAVKGTLQTRTVMITGISKKVRSDADLKLLFSKMYGEARVVDALLVRDVKSLRKLQSRRETLANSFYGACEEYEDNISFTKDESPMHRRGWHGVPFIGTKVDSIHYFLNKVKKMDRKILQKIKDIQDDAIQANEHSRDVLHRKLNLIKSNKLAGSRTAVFLDVSEKLKASARDVSSSARKLIIDKQVTRIGFCTFDSSATAMMSAQALHHKTPAKMAVRMAPVPSDVYWEWLPEITYSNFAQTRMVIVVATLTALFLSWSVPVTFIAAFANLQQLSSVPIFQNFLGALSFSPFLQGSVTGFMASWVLNVFMAFLPNILQFILKRSAYPSRSDLITDVMTVYYIFLLLNVFFVVTIAGSIFGILDQVIQSPPSVLNLLANSLPKQATFFASYVIVEALGDYPMNLLRLQDLIVAKFKIHFVKSRTEKEELFKCDEFDYASMHAKELLTLTIVLIYSTLAPVIIPVGLMYFILAYFSAKYNFAFVIIPEYEGIKMTKQAVSIMATGLIVFQLCLTGALGLKQFTPAVGLSPLPFVTLLFRWYLHRRFDRPFKYLALLDCPPVDAPHHGSDDLHEVYLDPALKPPEPLPEDIDYFKGHPNPEPSNNLVLLP